MRGGEACPGGARVTVASGPRAAERTWAQAWPPRVARALLSTDTGGATALQAAPSRRPALNRRISEARDLPTALTRLPAMSTPSPAGSRNAEGARPPDQLRPAQPQPGSRGAGGRREARAPVGRRRGAVRTAGTNGIAASGLRGRGITPGGGTGPQRRDGLEPFLPK